jgi:protein ImuB
MGKSALPIVNSQFSIFNLQSLMMYCGRFSPVVGFEPTDRANILLDITGLAHLFGGETALADAIVRGFKQLGLRIHLAIADTLGAAWAIAKADSERRRASRTPAHAAVSTIHLAPPGETFLHLAPLPIETLRLPAENVRLLHELGIVQISQVEALPRADLLPRFSPTLLMRLDQALGRLDEPVPASPVPPTFAADWSAEHPTSRRETIEAAISHLIRRISGMLAHCAQGVLRLECRLDCQAPATAGVRMSLGLFRPTADADHLLQLLALQLERLHIPAPVDGIHVEATLTAPLEPHRQTTLFDQDRAPGVHGRHLTMLIERLSSRLGSNAVVGIRLRPEAQPELSWHEHPLLEHRRHRRPSKTTPSELPPRPLRLLPRPVALDRNADAPAASRTGSGLTHVSTLKNEDREASVPLFSPPPFHPQPPSSFHIAGRQHNVAQSWGPERIETGWWRGRQVGRDYFHVETTAGRHFWLFRRLRDDRWFLHGIFD